MRLRTARLPLAIASALVIALIAMSPLYPALMIHQLPGNNSQLPSIESRPKGVESENLQNIPIVAVTKPIEFGSGIFSANLSRAENLNATILSLGLDAESLDKLSQNGFIVLRINFPLCRVDLSRPPPIRAVAGVGACPPNTVNGYSGLRVLGIPTYITSDAIIEVNHFFYSSLRTELEERYVIPSQERLLSAMTLEAERLLDQLPKGSKLYEAQRANLEYLYLASGLQNEKFRSKWGFSGRISQENGLIEKANGNAISPIFGSLEDYSQYKPRGDYARLPRLINYFKAATWLSRMRFDLGSDFQTLQGLLLSNIIKNSSVGNVTAFQSWQGIYNSTAFFAGESDDLTFQQYVSAMDKIYGPSPSLEELSSLAKLASYREELYRMDSSRILGTIGSKERTLGLRFLGQRFAIDSYVHHALSHDRVNSRFMIKGLDVPAAFGSSRAEKYLSDEFTKYPDYRNKLEGIGVAISEIMETEWNRNLYMSSFDSFRTLLHQSEGSPAFMRGEAWADKSLNTFLAGWSLLRHDTLAYTKQPYVESSMKVIVKEVIIEKLPSPPHYGYVEPQPYLYSKMKFNANKALNELNKMGILDKNLEKKLIELSSMMEDLTDASLKELRGEELSNSQQLLLHTFYEKLTSLLSGLRSSPLAKDPDVFTDPKSGLKLAAESGFPYTIVVLYETPDGRTFLGAGMILTYYEFTTEKRLSDAEWTWMLVTGKVLGEPQWVGNYTASQPTHARCC